MNNILYIDTENGSKTLGGEEIVEKLFGNPVIRPETWAELYNLLFGEIYHKAKIIKNQTIGGGFARKSEQIVYQLNEGINLNGIVIDTLSTSISSF